MKCGYELAVGANFCPECGLKTERRCSACEAVVSLSARFCGQCGVKLADIESGGTTTSVENQRTKGAPAPTPKKATEGESVPVVPLSDVSFVVLSAGLGSVQDICDENEWEPDNQKVVLAGIQQALQDRKTSLVESARACRWINHSDATYVFFTLDNTGSGFRAALTRDKHKDIQFRATSKELLDELTARYSICRLSRIDISILSVFQGAAPSVADFQENDDAGEIARAIESGVEICCFDKGQNAVTYSSWDCDGEIDEGFLDDPDDKDWHFKPSMHPFLQKLKVRISS